MTPATAAVEPRKPRSFDIVGFLERYGVLLFLVILVEAFAKKRIAGDNPWGVGATTLEWTLPSPPAFHSYETLPRITGADH